MTCGPEPVRYRILDPHAHWRADLAPVGDESEAEVGQVIRLRPTPAALRAIIDRYFLPPALAHGCGPCDWFLVTAPPCPLPGLLQLRGGRWCLVRAGGCHLELERPVAVAGSGRRVAVRDAGRGEVILLSPAARRIAQATPVPGKGAIALDRRGRLAVADGDAVLLFGRDGELERRIEVGAPVSRLRSGACGDLWIASLPDGDEPPLVWRFDGGAGVLRPIEGDLAAALDAAGLPTFEVSTRPEGFCMTLPRGTASPVTLCFDWCGRPIEPPGPQSSTRVRTGTVATAAARPIDSRIPRCRWHRVRLDAELPPATSIAVEVAATEGAGETPHADDWQRVTDAALDFLIDQPAGRYLHIRFTLSGHGESTPVIRRVRVDFPRSTSAEWLPAVYRDAPESRAFLDRFLALFDAGIEDLDAAIERFPALLDSRGAHDQILPWLGSLLAVTLDPSWAPERRRALLQQVPELYRLRGTPDGVRRALEAIAGVAPAIEELGAPVPFGSLAASGASGRVAGGAQLGRVRLFGRGRARARLGSSALGATQLRSYGDPDDDARSALAFRVRVQMPAAAGIDRARLERLVASQVPAHVVASVRVGERAPSVGAGAGVGVDTALVGLPRPILGAAGNVRLRRRSALWPGPGRGDAAIAVGRAAAVGMHTILR